LNIHAGISTWLLSLSLLFAAGCGGGGGGGSAPGPAPTPPGPSPSPGIVSVQPANNATGVPLGTPIRVVFEKDMDPATLTLATMSIRSAGAPVTGSLRYNTLYEVTVTTGARDASGNPLPGPYTWRFTTEAAPSSLAGVLFFDNNAGVSCDAPARTATLDINALYPLAGIVVKAVRPSSDNSATVVAEDSTAAAASGAFGFPGLSQGKWLIVAEKIFPAGAVLRILGVSTTNALGTPLLHYVPMTDVTPGPAIIRLDAYCLACHPFRDGHVSGVVPVNATKPTGRYDAYGRVTCDSCHSVHYPTGFQHYVWGSGGSFCNQCH